MSVISGGEFNTVPIKYQPLTAYQKVIEDQNLIMQIFDFLGPDMTNMSQWSLVSKEWYQQANLYAKKIFQNHLLHSKVHQLAIICNYTVRFFHQSQIYQIAELELKNRRFIQSDVPTNFKTLDFNEQCKILDRAVFEGSVEVVELLLKDIDSSSIDWRTKLAKYASQESTILLAAKNGHAAIVKLLLAHGGLSNHRLLDSKIVIVVAEKGYRRVLELLLDNGEISRIIRVRAVIQAARNGHWEVVKLLLSDGDLYRVISKDPKDWTERGAAEKGQLEILKLLLESGGTDVYLDLELMALVASQHGHWEAVKLLLANGSSYNRALMVKLAAENDDWKTVEQLLADGSLIDCLDNNCQYLILVGASKHGLETIVAPFLEKKILISNCTQESALSLSTQLGHTKIVKLWLENGARVSEEAMRVTMYTIIKEGYEEIVQLFLDKGVISLELHAWMVYIASSLGQRRTVERLLANEVVLPKTDEYGEIGNPIEAAILGGHVEVVELLLEKATFVSEDNQGGLVRSAAYYGQRRILELLLKDGLFLSIEDRGYALRQAAERGHQEIVELLLADGPIPTGDNARAAKSAIENGHQGIADLLTADQKRCVVS